jgi:hypothetical protein
MVNYENYFLFEILVVVQNDENNLVIFDFVVDISFYLFEVYLNELLNMMKLMEIVEKMEIYQYFHY